MSTVLSQPRLSSTMQSLCEHLPDLPPPAIVGPWAVICTKSCQERPLAEILLKHNIPFYLPLDLRKSRSRNSYAAALFPGFLFVAPTNPSLTATNLIANPNPSPNPSPKPEYSAKPVNLYAYNSTPTEIRQALQLSIDFCFQTRKAFSVLHSYNQPKLRSELALIWSDGSSLPPTAQKHPPSAGIQQSSTPSSAQPRSTAQLRPMAHLRPRSLRILESLPNGTPVRIRRTNPPHAFADLEGMIRIDADHPVHSENSVRIAVDLDLLGRIISVDIDADLLEKI